MLSRQQETATARTSAGASPWTERWREAAREQFPGASDAEVERIAGELAYQRRREVGANAIRARMEAEDPAGMTAAALSSPRHVGAMSRWEQAAREQDPGASDEQLARVAAELRRAYFSEIGRISGQARRAARARAAEDAGGRR